MRKRPPRWKVEITQLKKALQAAEAGRTEAEKETAEAKSKLADARDKSPG